MKGSDFIFDSIQLIHYKCHKVSFKRGGSFIVSADVKSKKATTNLKIENEKSF